MIIYQSKKPCSNEEENETPILGASMAGEDLTGDKSNNIFLYEVITDQSVLRIRKAIDKKVVAHRKFLVENDLDVQSIEGYLHINLFINSYGGSVPDAFNLHDYIKRCLIPIYTYIEGIAASAATIISLSGKKRFMTPRSLIMIHQLSSWFGGKYEEFQDEKANMDLLMKMIKEVYLEHTKLTPKKLNSLIKRDIYLGAEKCLEYGFVDEIF